MKTIKTLAMIAMLGLITSSAYADTRQNGYRRTVSNLSNQQLRLIKNVTGWNNAMRVQGLNITNLAKRTAGGEVLILAERQNRGDRGAEPAKLISIKNGTATILSRGQAKYRGLRSSGLAGQWANDAFRRITGAFSGVIENGYGQRNGVVGYFKASQTTTKKLFIPVQGNQEAVEYR